jgi:hypothetical protein
VAEWLARIVPRRAWSTSSTAGWPGAISPSATSAMCRKTPATLRVSVIVAVPVSVFSVPVSPTCPPDSA